MPVTFASLGVPADLSADLEARGITSPTPIQHAALPDLLAGYDVCGGAPTGSGKTLAFGLPLLARLGSGRARPHQPRALILAPTRELARQIDEVLVPLAATRSMRTATVYGGVGFTPQIRALRQGVEILVACPGRLEDLIGQGVVRLDAVEILVIDEADRMADMGFLPAVVRILGRTPAQRQTVLFSATLDRAVDKLVRSHLRDARHHRIAATEEHVALTTHLFWSATREQRVDLCAQVASKAGRTIVFTRTKHGADRLAQQLTRAGVEAAAIHGGRSQGQRDRALDQFHRGVVTTLVATDVAARGIHVDAVGCVIHADPPGSAADYQHRSGRTARAGASGVVVSLVGEEVRSDVRSLQRELGMPGGITRPSIDLIPVGEPIERLPEPPATRPAADAARPAHDGPRRDRGGRGRRGPTGSSSGNGRGPRDAQASGGPSGNRSRTGRAPAGRSGSGSGSR